MTPVGNRNSERQTDQGWRISAIRLPIMLLSKVFVVLVCVSLLATDVLRTWDAREIKLREAEASASNLTRSLAQHAEDTVKEADTILVGLVERVETDGVGDAQLKRLRGLMTAQVAELPKLHGLFLYDETGRWLVNSQPSTIRSANNSDREYFIYHRTHPDRSPYIGKPVRSRSTGEWILTVSRRINRPDGSFAGVALATVHVSYLKKFYDTFEIGNRGVIFLMRTEGTVMMRRPFADEYIGGNVAASSLFRDHLPKSPFGTYISDQTVIDAADRIVSYRQLEGYPMIVAVSFSTDEILQSWWAGAYKHFLATALLALALGYMGFRLTRQIGLRLNIENDLRIAQSKLEALNGELEKMAMQDGLTGLANRRLFDLTLNAEFNRAMRGGSSIALIMIDVDAFKDYNDAFGHPEGDDCLRRVSEAVKACQSRSGDLVARYGGEEIAVLLPDTDLLGAMTVAERIRRTVRDLGIQHTGTLAGVVTVSCGVEAMIPVGNRDLPGDLVHAADAALYLAKAGGRDQVVPAQKKP